MEIVLIILSIIIILLLIAVIILVTKRSSQQNETERLIKIEAEIEKVSPLIDRKFLENSAALDKKFTENSTSIDRNFRDNRKEISDNLEKISKTIDTRVRSLQEDNSKKLDQMREVVDEKLQASVEKRFNETFKTLQTQLGEVNKGVGEMKNLASDVGSLKKVMEGVKTRGIYGEVQLGAIIADTLNPSQYYENKATKPGSKDVVEFAVRMPGKKDGEEVLLPIDSKFPMENYTRLLDAYDSGNKVNIEKYRKALATDIREQAKKISSKYLEPPKTTDFGVMFVPTESLYAEILRIPGLFDEIREKNHVTIASPSTLPIMLSGLLMGFKTLAIEQRSAEVWQVLGAVKTQFGKFGDLLEAVQKKLQESANKIETAKTSSRQIERKLKDVEELPESESVKLIGEI